MAYQAPLRRQGARSVSSPPSSSYALHAAAIKRSRRITDSRRTSTGPRLSSSSYSSSSCRSTRFLKKRERNLCVNSLKDSSSPSRSSLNNAETNDGIEELWELPGSENETFTKVYKFGGSSVATAERMREVANIVCLFKDESPIVVLSAMGKTTNNLIIAGEMAVDCKSSEVRELEPLRTIVDLHQKTMEELEIDSATREDVESLLDELSQLLVGISLLKDLTPRSLDSLVSFGERLSTRIFSGYLKALGIPSLQYDAFDLGITTTDQFTNGDILYDVSMERVEKSLKRFASRAEVYGNGSEKEMLPVVPVVTGFLGKGEKTGAITTLGRGGSDLTATFLGMTLEIDEVVVWKDVDGVLTTDPRVVPEAVPIPLLTVEEAAELAYFGATVLHPQSMQPLLEKQRRRRGGSVGEEEDGGIADDFRVRVRNSYNVSAPGSVICAGHRDMQESLLTSIILKSGVNMLDIVSTRMLGQYGFLSKVFRVFEDLQISVDVVATSEVSVSVTLDISKVWARDLKNEELLVLEKSFEGLATVELRTNRTIISLIGNPDRSNEILEKTFGVLTKLGVNPEMISKGAFKNNIALIVPEEVGELCLKNLHEEFFREGK